MGMQIIIETAIHRTDQSKWLAGVIKLVKQQYFFHCLLGFHAAQSIRNSLTFMRFQAQIQNILDE